MNYINYVVEPKVQKGSGRIKAELREVFRRFGLIMIGPSELSLYYVRLTEVSVKDVSVIRQGDPIERLDWVVKAPERNRYLKLLSKKQFTCFFKT